MRFFNRMDESFGLICTSISRYLMFHIDTASTPNEVWKKLKDLFGQQDVLHVHHLENELIGLSPASFSSLQAFFTKFKSLLTQLKSCNVDKDKDQLILSILSKLGSEYSVFVSSFHASKLTTPKWEMPSLDAFIAALLQEQDKLISMGSIKCSKNQALTANEGRKGYSKDKQKGKGKATPDQK